MSGKAKTRCLVPLTDEQRQLIEENHNLIFGFLNAHHLPENDWYDVAAIGLCRSLEKYDPNIGALSGLAYLYMLHAVQAERRYTQRHAPPAKSLDEPVASDTEITLNNQLEAMYEEDDPQDIAIASVQFEQAVAHAPALHIKVLKLRSSGMSYREIGERLGIPKYSVGRYLSRVRSEFVGEPDHRKKAAQGQRPNAAHTKNHNHKCTR